jgi:dihydroorotate dehydrogenase electron transfer subunit
MGKVIRDLKVIGNEEVSKGYFVITVMTGEPFLLIKPGQFLQLKVEGSSETFLRRPVSVHDYDINSGLMKLLIHVVGTGTSKLSQLSPGENINAVFPLGNSFSIPDGNDRVLLVGGGCGVAPLMFLGRTIHNSGLVPEFLLGFRNSESQLLISEYESLGKVHITTEDGSSGVKGYVTSHPILKSENYNKIYCCGPDAMMKAVGRIAEERGIECEVSLENLMACGFGVCLCCVVPTTRGNVCTCSDGPVYNTKELKW